MDSRIGLLFRISLSSGVWSKNAHKYRPGGAQRRVRQQILDTVRRMLGALVGTRSLVPDYRYLATDTRSMSAANSNVGRPAGGPPTIELSVTSNKPDSIASFRGQSPRNLLLGAKTADSSLRSE